MKKVRVKRPGVFVLKRKDCSKAYVGAGKDLDATKRGLKSELKRGVRKTQLARDYTRLGGKMFNIVLKEYCSEFELQDTLEFYIKQYDSIENGYNKASLIPRFNTRLYYKREWYVIKGNVNIPQ